MTIQKDIGTPSKSPIHSLGFIHADTGEKVAEFIEKQAVVVPERGDSIRLGHLIANNEEQVESYPSDNYIVEDITYSYDLIDRPDHSDRLSVTILIEVTPDD